MKFIHLADLHLGKRVNGFSMIDDQRYILQQILQVIDARQPQAVLIAGDVYDRAVPSEEAVALFDRFLVDLADRGCAVLLISGNHDSAERVAFGGQLMHKSGIYVAPVYRGSVQPIILHDAAGEVAFYLLPFVKPVQVRPYFPDLTIETYTDALRAIIGSLELRPRSVAVAHQFVTGASLSGSEELSIGGLDAVEASVFAPFAYTALGHLHGAQRVGSPTVRYAGSPLKYAIAERNQAKSVTVVELDGQGQVQVELVPLTPKRDVCQFRGSFAALAARPDVCADYCEVILTDEQDIPNAMNRLRAVYPNLMHMAYDNTRTRTQSAVLHTQAAEQKPIDLFEALYTAQNGQAMPPDYRAYMEQLIAEIWEDAQ